MTWYLIWTYGLWPILAKYGIVTLAIIGLLAWAWFMPVFKKTALWLASLLFITSIAYTVGVKDEHNRCEAQLNASIQAETVSGKKARSKAVNTIKRDTPDRVRNDPYNRDTYGSPK